MRGKVFLPGLFIVGFMQADVFVPSSYQPRYTLLASNITLESGNDTWDPYAYLLRNRHTLSDEDKASFILNDSVDVSKIGEYQVTYNQYLALQVHVQDTTAPTVSLNPLHVIQNEDFAWDEQRYASIVGELEDNTTSSTDLMKQFSCSQVDTQSAGSKSVECKVKDNSGNEQTAQLPVQVQGVNADRTTPKSTSVAAVNQTITLPTAAYSSAEMAQIQQVVALVNEERAKYHLAPVTLNLGGYHHVTYLRAQEVYQSYSHVRPNGQACYTIFSDYGLGFTSSGENIAQGQQTPQEVVQDWMNSTSHRENILRPEFTIISVGVLGTGSNKVWVQEFFS